MVCKFYMLNITSLRGKKAVCLFVNDFITVHSDKVLRTYPKKVCVFLPPHWLPC